MLGRLNVCDNQVFNFSQQHKFTPIATSPLSNSLQFFFARPAELVAPDLIGCLLVSRHASGELVQAVIVETEVYSKEEPACYGHRRRAPYNETMFGVPGRFYDYVSY